VRKILVLVNPTVESRRSWNLSTVVNVFESANVEVEVLKTGENRGAGEQARQAVAQGVDAVVVCGGDGTIFDVLQGLADSQVALGIVPLGTGNILAQNLKVPRNPIAAARWLLTAKPRTVSLGKITCFASGAEQSWFFASAAGMGAHAAMMQTARRYGKDRTGRSAYFAAGAALLLSYQVKAFDIEVTALDGIVHKRRVSEVLAVRVAELNLWRPGGDLSYPFLRIATVEGESRWRLAQASVQALFFGGGSRDHCHGKNAAARYEDVLRVECRPIPGVSYDEPIAVEADGEILGVSRVKIEMSGASVNLLVQQDSVFRRN